MRRTPVLHLLSAVAATLAVSSATAAAEQHPTPVETHEVPIDQQVEVAQSMADHEIVAQRFEAEAAQFETQAAEHQHLATGYRRGVGSGPKADLASLAEHCERIARNLREAATEARTMAGMHRTIAHKLVK